MRMKTVNIADDNLPMKIIKFRYNDIHKEGDDQEDTADEAAESIEEQPHSCIFFNTAVR